MRPLKECTGTAVHYCTYVKSIFLNNVACIVCMVCSSCTCRLCVCWLAITYISVLSGKSLLINPVANTLIVLIMEQRMLAPAVCIDNRMHSPNHVRCL